MAGTAEGRVALITGAGQGLGRAMALALGAQGATVAVNDKIAERAERTAEEIRKAGGKAHAAPFDVRFRDQVVAGVEKIEREIGPIDILCNNAGGGAETGGNLGVKFKDTTPDQWSKSLDLDFMGALTVLHVVLPGMSKRGWGRVVQTTSAAGSKGFPIGLSIYGAAKAAIEGAMRNIAVEEAKSGVTLNSITPGLLSNNAGRPGMDGVGAASTIGTLASVPLGRFTEPTEVAAAVVWLTSEPGGVVTGQTIHINGGSLHGR